VQPVVSGDPCAPSTQIMLVGRRDCKWFCQPYLAGDTRRGTGDRLSIPGSLGNLDQDAPSVTVNVLPSPGRLVTVASPP
jgi:hypothetical protein